MDPITGAMLGSAVSGLLSGIGSFLGGQQQASANSNASLYSAMAQMAAMQQQQAMYNDAKKALSPYMSTGSNALQMLMGYLQGNGAQNAGIGGGGANLMSTFAPTMAQLESTPGYQFAKDQGLKAVQNSAAGKGLGYSGNALQGGVDYAEGLASTTFQQQLQNFMNQNQQAYNMLMGPSQLGRQAAGALGGVASNMGNALLGAGANLGNTMAGGIMGQANALSGGLQGLLGGVGSGMGNALSMPYVNSVTNFGQRANPVSSTWMPNFSQTEMPIQWSV